MVCCHSSENWSFLWFSCSAVLKIFKKLELDVLWFLKFWKTGTGCYEQNQKNHKSLLYLPAKLYCNKTLEQRVTREFKRFVPNKILPNKTLKAFVLLPKTNDKIERFKWWVRSTSGEYKIRMERDFLRCGSLSNGQLDCGCLTWKWIWCLSCEMSWRFVIF
jgi:hypothetical protein